VAGAYPTQYFPTEFAIPAQWNANVAYQAQGIVQQIPDQVLAAPGLYPVTSAAYTYNHNLLTPPQTQSDQNVEKARPKIMTTTTVKQSPQRSTAIDHSPVSQKNSETGAADAEELASASASKPKRVRTGCLTCRERHLKCDEGMPNCHNCKKSNRKCKRGVRLNFIDITCQEPPFLLPRTRDFHVHWQDESREIASEYVGGAEKYAVLKPERPQRVKMELQPELNYDYPGQMAAPVMSHQQLPPQPGTNGMYQTYPEPPPTMYAEANPNTFEQPGSAASVSYSEPQRIPQQAYDQTMLLPPEQGHSTPVLEDRNEVLYMQVFVEEVGLWMDSMDPDKHFSRLLPFQALRQPMLKHALLACGVRHLTLVNTAYPDEQAIHYYNTATQLLLKSLQNPDRDSVLCATTATVLNVYEVMSEKALQRMNHIAGARALIKECRWDATSTGIGAACFWLNVGLELFSCLHFNWGVAWDPDTWGMDITMNPQQFGGDEENWTHKILYILAHITNYRSSVPRFQEQTVHAEQTRLHNRHQKWLTLKHLCDKWDACVPQTMHPMAVLPTYVTSSKSSFPEVWLIKRSTIVARLFYHTALALLGDVHPMANVDPQVTQQMQDLRLYHSRQICGIVAHVKDR
jgi:hypothetical protein